MESEMQVSEREMNLFIDERMYGMSEDSIRKVYIESPTAKLCGLEMVVASMLSDIQELICMKGADFMRDDLNERVRKELNIAKYILGEIMDEKRAAA